MTTKTQPTARPYDVALVGGGIMSATLGILLRHLEPTWSIAVFERLPDVAQEASAAWHNAGTGHAGLCELNYTPEKPDGSIDIAKAITVNEQFQLSRQLWATLVEAGILRKPESFINPVPHMTFVQGAEDVNFLRKRHETLSAHPLFASMRFSDKVERIGDWAPLLTEERTGGEPIAATHDITGSDIDFGTLTDQMIHYLERSGVAVHRRNEVWGMRKNNDGSWLLKVHHWTDRDRFTYKMDARFVFAGTGGWALKLLQKAGIPEARGYGLLPVSGRFLRCDAPEVVERHNAKVYGKAPVGAPPMSMPHLDTRIVDGKRSVLFGPYAGIDPRFLKNGSLLDAPASLRPHNLGPLAGMMKDNLDLLWLLVSQVAATRNKKLATLREFAPTASLDDWTMITAGQRAQIVKRDPATGRGALQFGTEVITAQDGSIAAVLGASPGASTAPAILLDLLERSFPHRWHYWTTILRELIPTFGRPLSADPKFARYTMTRTAETLGLAAPVSG
ncbi:malate dehydrogenase (quinone) [Nocardia sp. IFM 10818]